MLVKKIKNNLEIYKNDVKTKGVYWSLVDRLLKIPVFGQLLIPLINSLKPGFVIIKGNKIFLDKTD
jgi:hypothetical protein